MWLIGVNVEHGVAYPNDIHPRHKYLRQTEERGTGPEMATSMWSLTKKTIFLRFKKLKGVAYISIGSFDFFATIVPLRYPRRMTERPWRLIWSKRGRLSPFEPLDSSRINSFSATHKAGQKIWLNRGFRKYLKIKIREFTELNVGTNVCKTPRKKW